MMENDALIIHPLYRDTGEFSVEILKELVTQGYSGEELIRQFDIYSHNIKKTIGHLLEESEQIATGQRAAATFEDIFGDGEIFQKIEINRKSRG